MGLHQAQNLLHLQVMNISHSENKEKIEKIICVFYTGVT